MLGRLVFAALVLLVALAWWNRRRLRVWFRLFVFPERLELSDDDRILVVAPHCDDETLGAGGLIAVARQRGLPVRVVVVTNGDGFRYGVSGRYRRLRPTPDAYIRYAYARQDETREALQLLGVSPEDVVFLGYPDRGISRLWSPHWSPDEPYTSVFTRCSRSPYRNSRTPGAPYCGQALLQDLKEELAAFRPTLVVAPHAYDAHPDHWATHAFVVCAVQECARAGTLPVPRMVSYLIHRGRWPEPKGVAPHLRLLPPRPLAAAVADWVELPLPDWAVERKLRAIRAYRSQVALMGRYLISFARANEMFTPVRSVRVQPVVRGDAEHFTAGDDQPEPLVGDPLADTVLRRLQGRADIRGLSARHDRRFLYLRLDLRAAPSRLVRYVLYAGSLDDPQRRLVITLLAGRDVAWVEDPIVGVRYTVRALRTPRGWAVKIPLAWLGRPESVLISAETRIGRLQVDHIAWAQLQLVREEMPA